MDSKIIEILSEEIRETRNLTLAVRKETVLLVRSIREDTKETRRRADAAWELVAMTREEMKQSKKPLWRRWFG